MSTLNTYATLDQLRARQNLAVADTADDARFLTKLRAASAQIDRHIGRTFSPSVGTRLVDYRSVRTLLFRTGDLLELTTLTNGDGSIIDPSAIILLGGIFGPFYGIELDVTKAFFLYMTTKTRCLSVTGVWGWHDDYANAWRASGDAITTFGISAGSTTLTVSNAAGADSWNNSPRFQIGQLLRIESEYLHLIGVNTATNALTVVRGANGSAPAAHVVSTPISVYVPPVDVTEIALRWAGWLLRLEDSGDYGGQTSDPMLGGGRVPSAFPPDLVDELVALRKVGGAV